MTLVVGILFFGLAVMSKADEVKTYKIQDTLNTVGQIPNKLGNHISNEIEEIKDALRNCLALANRDPDIEELCFGAVFNSDYFWY